MRWGFGAQSAPSQHTAPPNEYLWNLISRVWVRRFVE